MDQNDPHDRMFEVWVPEVRHQRVAGAGWRTTERGSLQITDGHGGLVAEFAVWLFIYDVTAQVRRAAAVRDRPVGTVDRTRP